mmetsp:Transcript_66701/g.191705  ORF Transcript_66701/g.191705 Transcript_66701/m.191705 type:complete len:226 (-) Transcript_66701:200-877(-)
MGLRDDARRWKSRDCRLALLLAALLLLGPTQVAKLARGAAAATPLDDEGAGLAEPLAVPHGPDARRGRRRQRRQRRQHRRQPRRREVWAAGGDARWRWRHPEGGGHRRGRHLQESVLQAQHACLPAGRERCRRRLRPAEALREGDRQRALPHAGARRSGRWCRLRSGGVRGVRGGAHRLGLHVVILVLLFLHGRKEASPRRGRVAPARGSRDEEVCRRRGRSGGR